MQQLQLKIPPPVYLVITGTLMWWADKLYPQQHFQGGLFSILTILCIGLGLLLDLSALWQFLAKKTTPSPLSPHKTKQLVTSGWYSFSRNPMYLGMILLLIGWALYLSNGLVLLFVSGFIFVLTVMQIKPEEIVLNRLFGEEYTQYCQRVRRWI